MGFKGAFRRLISGTGYESATLTLKTTLGGFDHATSIDFGRFSFRDLYQQFVREIEPKEKGKSPEPVPVEDALVADEHCDDWTDLYSTLIRICFPGLEDRKPSKMFAKCLPNDPMNGRRFILSRREEDNHQKFQSHGPQIILWRVC